VLRAEVAQRQRTGKGKIGMDITEQRAGNTLILALTGELDGFTSSDVEKALLRRVEAGETRLILDLTGTTYVSSVGLGVLILVNKRLQQAGGRMCLCGLSEAIYQVFQTCGLDRLLELQTDCEHALASLT
jgi:anti-anti-sigma factor